MNFSEGPIIACSSGGDKNTAIAIIRLSGLEDLNSFQQFFSFNLKKVRTRFNHLSYLFDEDGKRIDHILFSFYKAPNSYTGENLLELAVHGNVLNIQRVIDLFTNNFNFTVAKGGEFTLRALRNKKLTLSQVEGLDLLLNAQSYQVLEKGLDTIHGQLFDSYFELRNKFIRLKSAVELSIDFLDDIGEENSAREFKNAFEAFKNDVDSLYLRTRGRNSDLISPTLVLAGKTNAGKSTLFNKLLKNSRSIVSDIEGTTRDYVSESVLYKGINFNLVDTAGIRSTTDKIEKEGIVRSLSMISSASFSVYVLNPFNFTPEDLQFLEDIKFDLLVITHSDCDGFSEKLKAISKRPNSSKTMIIDYSSESGSIGPEKNGPMGAGLGGSIGPKKTGPMGAGLGGSIGPKKSGPMGADLGGSIGPKNNGPMGADLHGPIGAIFDEFYFKYNNLAESSPILIERHRDVIKRLSEKVGYFKQNIFSSSDIAIISSEINMLGDVCDELIGIVSPDEVLNTIFSNFCIGK